MSSGDRLTLSLGIVKDNADPAQHGRLKVFIPAVDSREFRTDDLPWATYVSPFGGTTADPKVGRNEDSISGMVSYGFWAIPKNGAQVLVGFLEGDPNFRFWMGCFFLPELNRTMPGFINGLKTEIDEGGAYPQNTVDYLKENINEAGLGENDSNFRTVGGYERSISHPSNKNVNKPDDNGYAKKLLDEGAADSQMHVFRTPGGHYISYSDIPEYCRIRLRTVAGSQILMDDTNERIYISTARGRNFVELDEGSGKINVYSTSKVNIHSENDVNISSEENINLVAKKRVNIVSEERSVRLQGYLGVYASSEAGDLRFTASRDIHLKTVNGQQGGSVSSNQTCNKPPYSGEPLGLTRDWSEEGGGGSSKIYLNAVESIDVKSDNGSILLTSMSTIQGRAMTGDVTLEAGGNINHKAIAVQTMAGSLGGIAIDPDGSIDPVISDESFQGSAQTADSATGVEAEGVREKMILPKHESWNRDEAEEGCETPRNKNFQG